MMLVNEFANPQFERHRNANMVSFETKTEVQKSTSNTKPFPI